MKWYRIWCDHPESDFHGWMSDLVHRSLDEAQRELEMFQETDDLSASFEIKTVGADGNPTV